MNRICIDSSAIDSGAAEFAANAPFRRAFAITVATLAALCLLFLTLAYLQGPKLESARLDAERAVAEPGQLLRLFANQALTAVTPEQVTIEPAAAFTVSTSGEVVGITLDERLRYDESYTVTVEGVTSSYSDRAATLSYSFQTGSVPLTYLDRGLPNDEIIRTGFATSVDSGAESTVESTVESGVERTVLYAAPGIQAFGIVTPTVVAVVSLNGAVGDDATSRLELVDTTTGLVETVPLPSEGAITNFAVSDSGTILGFELDDMLMRLDLDAGRDIVAVKGLDGTPMRDLAWTFAPASTDLVVQAIDGSILRIAADGAISPLGKFTRMGQLSIDDRVLTVFDQFGALALSLDTLETQRIEPAPLDGEQPSGSAVDVLPNGDRVQRVAVFHADTGRFDSLVVLDDGTESRVLYQTPKSEGSIEGFRVSPNGQYVAVEAIPSYEKSVDDGYALDRRSTSVQTIIVEIETGAVIRIVDGFGLDW